MDDLLQQGITAYKAGKRDDARKIFITVVKQSPDSEPAWGWMYQASNTDQERIHCLKQILRINPKSVKANELLNQLLVPPLTSNSPFTSTPSPTPSSPSLKQVDSSDIAPQKSSNNSWIIPSVVISFIVICAVILGGWYVIYGLNRQIPSAGINLDSETVIQTAIAQTQVAVVQTQAAQKTPLAEINLDSVLFQSGDLPSQYSSGQIAYQWPDGLPQAFTPENLIIQKVGWDITEGYAEDYLMVALYESQDNLEKSYQDIVKNFSSYSSESAQVGDKATFIFLSTFSGRGFIIFTRCNALVATDFTGADVSKDLMQAFAQRIDKRLKPLVCNK